MNHGKDDLTVVGRKGDESVSPLPFWLGDIERECERLGERGDELWLASISERETEGSLGIKRDTLHALH